MDPQRHQNLSTHSPLSEWSSHLNRAAHSRVAQCTSSHIMSPMALLFVLGKPLLAPEKSAIPLLNST